MCPRALLMTLSDLLPGFAAYRADPTNLGEDEDEMTFHGVWMSANWFVRERFEGLGTQTRHALGQFVSRCMSPDGADDELSNAVATMFLEPLSPAAFADDLEATLTGVALGYLRALRR